jgi:hypothetical protein
VVSGREGQRDTRLHIQMCFIWKTEEAHPHASVSSYKIRSYWIDEL